jgi:hypothetical protein
MVNTVHPNVRLYSCLQTEAVELKRLYERFVEGAACASRVGP